MDNMKIETIKRYTASYYLVAVMPRNANTCTVEERTEACWGNIEIQAKDKFVEDMNKYRSVDRTPKWDEMYISVEPRTPEVNDETVLLGTNVTVRWLYDPSE